MNDFSVLFDDEKEAKADASAALPDRVDPKVEVPTSQAVTPSEPSLVEDVAGAFVDTGKAIGRGIEDAGRGALETGRRAVNMGIEALTPPGLRDKLPEGGVIPDPMEGVEHLVDEPEMTINRLAAGIVEFGAANVGGKKMLDMVSGAKAIPMAIREITDSAVGAAVVTDPHAERLSNLLQESPILANPVFEFLAANPDDSFAMGKLKATLEDMMMTPVAMTLLHGLSAMKNRLIGRDDALDIAEIEKHMQAADDASKGVLEVPEVVVRPEPSTNGLVSAESDGIFASKSRDMSLTAHMEGEGLFIDRIEVQQELRGNGTGTAAVKELEEFAMANGARTITGEALPGSEAFWKKQGFTVGEPEAGVGLRPISKDLPQTFDPMQHLDEAKGAEYKSIIESKNFEMESPGRARLLELRQEALADFKRVTSGVQDAKIKPLEKPAVEVKNAKGESIFKLNEDEKTDFLAQLAHSVQHQDGNMVVPVAKFFNFATMDSRAETLKVMSSVAELIEPTLTKSLGGDVQTLKMVKDSADYFGTQPEKLMANLSTYAKDAKHMAATVVAGKIAAQSMSAHIYSLGRKLYMDNAGDSVRLEMYRAIDILAEIEGMTKQIQKAAARTTSAGRLRTGGTLSGEALRTMLKDQDPKAMDNLVKNLVLTEGDPKSIAAVLRTESYFKKALETHNEYFINAILSKPSTHVVNILSAFDNAIMQPFFQVAGGAIRMDKSTVMNGVATWKALGTHVWDSLEMSRRVMATDKEMLDPGKGTIEGKPGSMSARNWNLEGNRFKEILGVGVDALGFVTRMTSRALRGEDEFFKQINYRAKVTANAAREAATLVGAGKLKAEDMSGFIAKKFEESFELQANGVKGRMVMGEKIGPEGDVLRQTFGKDESALKYANEGTFTQDVSDVETWGGLPSMGELVTRAAGHPAIRGAIIPFVKVPTNIFREGMNVGPAALLRKQFYADMSAGGDRAAVATGKLAMGSLIWVGAVQMAAEGMVTGNIPGDKDVRDRLTETGWKPYSIVSVDSEGKKHYTPINRLDPRFMPLTLAADLWQISHSVDDQVRNSVWTHAGMALAQNLSSKLYLKGVIDMASMVRAGFSNPDIAGRLAQMKAASYVPGAVQLLQGDDELKAVHSVVEAVYAKIPGWSQSVEAKRDYFGNKKIAEPGMQWSAINPFAGSDEKADPVAKEIARLALSAAEAKFTMPETHLGNIDLLAVKNTNGQTAYDRWTELAGTVQARSGMNFHDRLAQVMDSHAYKTGTDGNSFYSTGNRVMMIRNEREVYLEAAKRQMIKEFSSDPAAMFPDGKSMKDIVRIDTQTEQAMKRGKDKGVPNFLEAIQ